MKEPVFSPEAIVDLDEIYAYTEEKWGFRQAEDYLRGLRDTCRALGETKTGRRIKGLRGDYLALSY